MDSQRTATTLQWVGGVAWILATIASGGTLLIPTGIVVGVLYFQRPKCPFCQSRIKRGVAICRFCHKALAWPT